jgi:hypothetical protein
MNIGGKLKASVLIAYVHTPDLVRADKMVFSHHLIAVEIVIRMEIREFR